MGETGLLTNLFLAAPSLLECWAREKAKEKRWKKKKKKKKDKKREKNRKKKKSLT